MRSVEFWCWATGERNGRMNAWSDVLLKGEGTAGRWLRVSLFLVRQRLTKSRDGIHAAKIPRDERRQCVRDAHKAHLVWETLIMQIFGAEPSCWSSSRNGDKVKCSESRSAHSGAVWGQKVCQCSLVDDGYQAHRPVCASLHLVAFSSCSETLCSALCLCLLLLLQHSDPHALWPRAFGWSAHPTIHGYQALDRNVKRSWSGILPSCFPFLSLPVQCPSLIRSWHTDALLCFLFLHLNPLASPAQYL